MNGGGDIGLERRPSAPAFQAGPKRFGDDAGRESGRRKTRLLAGTCTVAVHLIVLGVLLLPRTEVPPAHSEPPLAPIEISLADQPKPEPPSPPQLKMIEPDTSATVLPPPRFSVRAPMRTATAAVDDYSDLLSDSQLAGAATVGEGGGGGTCDMARFVQQALRRDPLVRSAVEDGHRLGRAIMLWNGDWVRSGGQDGKGMSAVREAVMWEVAFAPAACRNRPVHGLVLLSLAVGSTRFAIGSGDWRWSDLLGVRGVPETR